MRYRLTVAVVSILCCSVTAWADGGPFGIDHRVSPNTSGIWKRSNQTTLEALMVVGTAAGALWEGGETRLGKTFWQSIDSTAIAAASTEIGKRVFGRERPSETDDPNHFFKGTSHHSFPSGEVAAVSAVITPFVFEYGREYPEVYALEALPVYVGIARLKSGHHWQSDVLVGLVVGTMTGYYAHSREHPLVLSTLPHGFMVGVRKQF